MSTLAQRLAVSHDAEPLNQLLEVSMPETEEELHALILERWGIDIPNVAVCREHGHVSPMSALWEVFSRAVDAVVWWAPRGGSKSFLEALLVRLDSLFRPGIEVVCVAATEAQAGRVRDHEYALLRSEAGVEPEKHPDVAYAGQQRLVWENGSVLEILPSTMAATNGPHSHLCLADEVELMAPDVFRQSRMISQSKGGYEAVDLITSTMKFAFGQMARIIGEIREAEAERRQPPYELRCWCWKEVAANQAHCCRVANPNLPEDAKCNCHKVVKGKLDSGEPRTFEHECAGDLARSAGYMSLKDLHRRFLNSAREQWDSEMACLKPSSEGLVFRDFSLTRHTLEGWVPTGGTVFQGVDWGGTQDPHCIVWVERIPQAMTLEKNGVRFEMPEGSFVVFDAIYRSLVGLDELAEEVLEIEDGWRSRVSGFSVAHRFADETGSGGICRQTWAERPGRQLITHRVGKDLDGSLKFMQELVGSDLLYVDSRRVPWLVSEIQEYHWKRGADKPEKENDHALDAVRYALWGARKVDRLVRAQRGTTGSSESPYRPSTAAGPSRYQPLAGQSDAELEYLAAYGRFAGGRG